MLHQYLRSRFRYLQELYQVFENSVSIIFRSCISAWGAVSGICIGAVSVFEEPYQVFVVAVSVFEQPYQVFVGAVLVF